MQVEGGSWKVVRPGAVSDDALRRQAACLVVFVCTGNTCRSPLAEGLFKARLAGRLGCTAAELPERGFHVLSAGMAAMSGGPAADEAVAVARSYGADLTGHRSRPLAPDLAAQADYLIAMTRGHCWSWPNTTAGWRPGRGCSARPATICPTRSAVRAAFTRNAPAKSGAFLEPLVEELQPSASNAPPNG